VQTLRRFRYCLISTWALLLCVIGSQNALAQLPDVAFNPDANGTVSAVALQPDGKLIVAGAFTQIAGEPAQRIARLLVNGAADPTFTPVTINGDVFAIEVQTDGKLLIGGAFTEVDSVPRNRVARLNAIGTLDTSFNPGDGANASVRTIAVQADGRVLLGGAFSEINGTIRNRLARLNTNGSLDSLFNTGSGANGLVRALALQADGRVLVAGSFVGINGISRIRIARLNVNGALDSSFDPGAGATGVNSSVYALAVQPDGRVLLGGVFANVGGVARSGVARLNANGSLDSSFDPGTGADGDVAALALQADGRVLLGGNFTRFDGTVRNRLARLSTSGALELGFNPAAGASDLVLALAVQLDGRVLLGGEFTSFNAISRNRIARLNANGGLDNGFNAGGGPNGSIVALAVQADGRVLLGGNFSSIAGSARNCIARINISGSLDSTFDPGSGGAGISGSNPEVFALALQADGRVLLGGGFDSFNGISHPGIVRLETDGTLDAGFNTPSLNGQSVSAINVQSDGRILLGTVSKIIRINADGSADSTHNPPLIRANALALQADNKVVVGERFAGRIWRLNSDGTPDPNFNTSAQADNEVIAIAIQANGRILLGGSFTRINGAVRNGIARLNPDGTLDPDFDPGTGVDGEVKAFALQSDGRILVIGTFSEVNGIQRSSLARLNANGTVDTGYGPPLSPLPEIDAIALQADGRALLGGFFTQQNGGLTKRIERLSSAQAALQSLSLDGFNVRWLRSGSAPALALPPTLELSLTGNPNSYSSLGTMSRITGGWQLAVPSLPQGQNFFVRAQGVLSSGQRNGSGGQLQSTAQLFLPDTSDSIFANGFESTVTQTQR
jgi:uncharacterized delta-60 repeat protein